MKKYFVIIILMAISAVLIATNPGRNSFEKYFAGQFSVRSEGVSEAVAADIFIRRCLDECIFKDYFLISTASVPTGDAEFLYVGALNKWVAVPVR
ncbi:MAG: hypothetical protein R6V47_06380 [Candidatus Delongbacteria bacterium]